MNDLPFYVLFSTILVISGRWDGDNEGYGTQLILERFPPTADFESLDQQAS